MAQEIKLPSLGKKTKSVEVLSVKVGPGDVVRKGQPLLEIESDKGTQDFPSPVAGKVTEVRVKDTDHIESGQVLFLVEGEGAAAPAKPSPPKPAEAKQQPPARPPEPKPQPQAPRPESRLPDGNAKPQAARPAPPQAAPAPVPATNHHRTGDGEVVRAGPATRHLARRLGVDLHKVRGSGRGGRITEDDVEHYVKDLMETGTATVPTAAPGVAVPELPDFEEWGPVERRPLSAVRRVTAEHMALCWSVIPHVTQHDEADITDLEAFRQEQKKAGVKLTVTAVALKACALALKAFPEFNASLDVESEHLILKRYYHIGVAVDTEHGLLVPVIRDVDKKSIEELAKELNEVAESARQRKADMTGGTFTISNLGGIGGTGFTPIVNWPQVAILGLSRGKLVPSWRDGQVAPRLMLPLSLSYDHRVIDGAAAARFTRRLAEMLENPWKMLLYA
jgi:pyruvate dehydrogenase E2 component (dihydrolipoamide acetyltransferase)